MEILIWRLWIRQCVVLHNYTEDQIKECIQGRGNHKRPMQITRKGISLISDIQERIQLMGSKGYEHKAKLTILKEAARTLKLSDRE